MSAPADPRSTPRLRGGRARALALGFGLLAGPWSAGEARAEPGKVPRGFLHPVEAPAPVARVAARGATEVWASGESGLVLRWDGSRWKRESDAPVPQFLFFLSAPGDDELWGLTLRGELVRRLEGQWRTYALPAGFEPTGLDFARPGSGYAVGLFGAIFRFEGERWLPVPEADASKDRSTHLRGVAALADHDVWVGGPDFLLHFDGARWERQPSPTTGGPRGSEVLRLEDGVVVSGSPSMLREAQRWVSVFPSPLRAVAGTTRDAWLLTEGGELWRWVSGSRELLQGEVVSIGSAGGHRWAVTAGGALLRELPYPAPRFVDVSYEAWAGIPGPGRQVASADLNRDGLPDVVLPAREGRSRVQLSTPEGRFEELRPAQSQLGSIDDRNRLALADLDGDGRVDLLVAPPCAAGGPCLEVWHQVAGTFAPLPVPLATADPGDGADAQHLDVADVDADGDLDVYQARFLFDGPGVPVPNVLWRNDGFGRLRPEPLADLAGGAAAHWSHSALLADLDGDGRVDLWSQNSWGEGSTVYLQRGDGTWRDATSPLGVGREFSNKLGLAAGDIDGDGDLDVLSLSAEPGGPSRLYRNDGRVFTDVTSAAGLHLQGSRTWGWTRAELGDLDLDGDLDLVVASMAPLLATAPPRFDEDLRLLAFLNDGKGRFTEVQLLSGPLARARDFLLDDFDGDGDLDLYLHDPKGTNHLLANQTSERRWLAVALDGAPPNRLGVGARVRLFSSGGRLLGMRATSWSHPVAHFGLLDEAVVDVEVEFPTGERRRLAAVTTSRRLTVRQASAPVLWTRRVLHQLGLLATGPNLPVELGKLLGVTGLLILLRLVGPRLGARRLWPRKRTWLGLAVAYALCALAVARQAPHSALAQLGPALFVGGLSLVALALDRVLTARAELRFVGPYEVLAVLGEGGMGVVYRARLPGSAPADEVALKVLRPELIDNDKALARFVREGEIGARLKDPRVVRTFASGECRVYDGFRWNRTAYLAMELVEGTTLRELMRARGLTLRQALAIAKDIALGLEVAHEAGVVHRDLKPENVFVTRAGEVKLGDFGVARLETSDALTEVGTVMGTLKYMAPECAGGAEATSRSDLYALGAILYEMLAGAPVVEKAKAAVMLRTVLTCAPRPLRQVVPGLPAAVELLVTALLQKVPERRPPAAATVVQALEAALAGCAPEALLRLLPTTTVELTSPPTAVTKNE